MGYTYYPHLIPYQRDSVIFRRLLLFEESLKSPIQKRIDVYRQCIIEAEVGDESMKISPKWLQNHFPEFITSKYYKSVQKVQEMFITGKIIDFTRRGGPETPGYLDLLRWNMIFDWAGHEEEIVLVFWTKSPMRTYLIYKEAIEYMISKGITILLFVTANYNFFPLEPGVSEEDYNLQKWISLLQKCQIRYPERSIHMRFDPIIVGTDPYGHEIQILQQYEKLILLCEKYNLERIVINFLVPSYKNAGMKLQKMGYSLVDPDDVRKETIIRDMLSITPQSIVLRVCAESTQFAEIFPGRIERAKCSDPQWAIRVNPKLSQLQWNGHPSRKGCGCSFFSDIVPYLNYGGYKCERGCPVCYAQNQNAVVETTVQDWCHNFYQQLQ